jgi:hypothetical protein
MTNDEKEREATNFIREWQEKRESEQRDKLTKLRTEVVPALRSIGVAVATLDYDGYGDSTNYEMLTLADADGKPISTSKLEYDENKMIDLMHAAVPDGYENNEGGLGQVILNVANWTIRNEHGQRVERIEHYEEEYTL